jgi:myosin VIIa
MLKDFIPMDIVKQLPADEWKKAISISYFKHGALNKDDAKIKFLEIIYQWPTFGSAFFEVKVINNFIYFFLLVFLLLI